MDTLSSPLSSLPGLSSSSPSPPSSSNPPAVPSPLFLPLHPFSNLSNQSTNNIQQAEAIIILYNPSLDKDRTRDLLKALLDYAPSPSSRKNIAHDIITQPDSKVLADYYTRTLLSPFLASAEKTPDPSDHPSGLDSINETSDEKASQARSQARLKKNLFLRDNNRCVISKIYDFELWEKLSDHKKLTVGESDWTEATHIVPFSLGGSTESQSPFNAAVWDYIFHVFPEVKGTFNVNDINDTSNAFTLHTPLRKSFGKFMFCLEATNVPNTYRINTFNPPSGQPRVLPMERKVTFTAHDDYPLPNPDLLCLHSTIAKVLHASGMRRIIEDALCTRQEIRCLAEDGSTDTRILIIAF